MSDAYMDGFCKTALAFGVNPRQLMCGTRRLYGRLGQGLRHQFGDKTVDSVKMVAGETMRGRNMLLPVAVCAPLVYSSL